MRAFSIALAGLAFAASPAFAQAGTPATGKAIPDLGPQNSRLTIAVGAATVPDYEGADSNRILAAGAVNGKLWRHNFWSRGTQLYIDLLPTQDGPGTHFELGVIGAARFNRTDIDSISDRRVRALGELDTAWEIGGFAGISKQGVITSDYDTLTGRVAYLHDISGKYDSYVITPQLNYSTPLSTRNLVSLGLSADYVGKGFGRYYYNVNQPVALPNMAPLNQYFINDSGFKNLNVSFFGIQSLSGDLRRGFGVGAGVIYSRLFGDYKRSPIVSTAGSASNWGGAVGLTYTF